jgi:hypothetical protein
MEFLEIHEDEELKKIRKQLQLNTSVLEARSRKIKNKTLSNHKIFPGD